MTDGSLTSAVKSLSEDAEEAVILLRKEESELNFSKQHYRIQNELTYVKIFTSYKNLVTIF